MSTVDPEMAASPWRDSAEESARDRDSGRVSGVQAIDRAVAILLCFDAHQPDLGVTEIARRTGLSTSTTHRLLGAMHKNRLVRRTRDRRYGLGSLLMQLARSGALPTTLRDAALPFMTALRDEVNETVALHELVPAGDRVVVDQVESHQPLRRSYTDIGTPIQLPAGAPGKAIYFWLSGEQQKKWRRQHPEKAVILDGDDSLTREQSESRARGWATSFAERTPGIRGVAAPIFDHTGDVVGAFGLSVPAARMDDARTAELGERVKETAWLVSQSLGAPSPTVPR